MRLSKEFSPVTIVMETKEEWDMLRKIIGGYSRLEESAASWTRGWRPSETAQAADKLDHQLSGLNVKGTFI